MGHYEYDYAIPVANQPERGKRRWSDYALTVGVNHIVCGTWQLTTSDSTVAPMKPDSFGPRTTQRYREWFEFLDSLCHLRPPIKRYWAMRPDIIGAADVERSGFMPEFVLTTDRPRSEWMAYYNTAEVQWNPEYVHSNIEIMLADAGVDPDTVIYYISRGSYKNGVWTKNPTAVLADTRNQEYRRWRSQQAVQVCEEGKFDGVHPGQKWHQHRDLNGWSLNLQWWAGSPTYPDAISTTLTIGEAHPFWTAWVDSASGFGYSDCVDGWVEQVASLKSHGVSCIPAISADHWPIGYFSPDVIPERTAWDDPTTPYDESRILRQSCASCDVVLLEKRGRYEPAALPDMVEELGQSGAEVWLKAHNGYGSEPPVWNEDG